MLNAGLCLFNYCASISAFALLVWVPVSITSSAVGINICAITAGIKKYKSIMTF